MKLFIARDRWPAGRLSQGFVLADKIMTLGITPNPPHHLAGMLDSGTIFTLSVNIPDEAAAERALRELCELIGRHVTDEPGSVFIGFNGREWIRH